MLPVTPVPSSIVVLSDDFLLDYNYISGTKAAESAAAGVRRRWEEILAMLERCSSVGGGVKRLILKGRRGDERWLGADIASALSQASQLVGEIIDEREELSVPMSPSD